MVNMLAMNAGWAAFAVGSLLLAASHGDGPMRPATYPSPDKEVVSLPRGDGPARVWTMTRELADLTRMETVTAAFLDARFDASRFTLDRVRDGVTDVPRLFLPKVPADMAKVENIDQRKRVFLLTMLPLILKSNEEIRADRRRLIAIKRRVDRGAAVRAVDGIWLERLGERYDTAPDDFDRLLRRVDEVPVSLALAQAVEESGWGTSRFARIGNAIFGQYTTEDDHGLVPKQRPEDRTFKIKAFPDLLSGIRSYMRNLNTHPSYASLRAMRADARAKGRAASGRELARTLTAYSERGEDYIRTLHLIIDANDLVELERNARLADPAEAHPDSVS
jgi:Bax protein